jgi:hypothetical protein
MAASVVSAPLEEFTSNILTRKRVIGRVLWEGQPALPSQPSPGSFKLLRNLVTAMGDAGLDLWSPAAVSVLKVAFAAQLSDAWRAKLDETVETQENESGPKATGDEARLAKEADEKTEEDDEKSAETVQPKNDTAELQKDILIQWLYDILLFQISLSTTGGSDVNITKLADEVFKKAELSNEARERMVKTSQDYWKRTSLLFGLLA